MNLRTQTSRGLKWQFVSIVGRQFLSLIVFTVLARLLDPASFGLLGLVAVYLGFVGMLADQGISAALVQRGKLEAEHLDSAFWFNFAVSALLCVTTIIFAGVIASMFKEPKLASLLRWSSLALIINSATAVHLALFMREMDFRRPVLRTLFANVAGGIIGISMAVTGFGVNSLIGQQLASALAGSIFIWNASNWRPRLKLSQSHLFQLLTIGGSVFATEILWFFSSRIDQIAIGRFAGPSVLGQYVVGCKLSDYARTVVHQPLASVTLPLFSRLQDNHEQLCKAIYKGMELNALVSFAIYVGLAAVAPSLVPFVFGESWKLASSLLQLTSVYALVMGLFVYCHPALLASGGPGRYVIVNATCAVGAVIACIVGLQISVQFLLVCLIINLCFISSLALSFLKRRIGLSIKSYCRPIVVPALGSVLMFGVVSITRLFMDGLFSPSINLGIQVFVGGFTYIAVIAIFDLKSMCNLREIVFSAIRNRANDV